MRLTLEQPDSTPALTPPAPYNDRRQEFEWLANESAAYAGEWVALDGTRLIAHGRELAVVSAAARAAGVDQPLLTRVPLAGELPFGGW